MKNTLYIKIGIRIKSARMHAKLRQYELAEMVNVTTQHISNIEAGTKAPSYDLLYRISAALNCPVYYFLPPNGINGQSFSNNDSFSHDDLEQLLKDATPYQRQIVFSFTKWFLSQPLPSDLIQ